MKKYLTLFAVIMVFAITGCQHCPKQDKAIYFDVDSYALTTEDKAELDQVAKKLNSHKSKKVKLFGYTDATGSSDHNMKLSEARAASAASYLEGKGIDSKRITLGAFGENSPAATNKTTEGRTENRRVEIHFYK